jgi:hypothetical protein
MRRFLAALFVALVAVVSAELAWELARENDKNDKDKKNESE